MHKAQGTYSKGRGVISKKSQFTKEVMKEVKKRGRGLVCHLKRQWTKIFAVP